MANRDVDKLEEDLSKKQRLINAWMAVGPEGKTTDVSDLTDSSRGYASDLRRALEGENEDEIDIGEIKDAYHPELVEKYRSELGKDAIDGEWEFLDELRRRPEAEQPSAETTEPSGRTPPQQEPQAASEAQAAGGREPERRQPTGAGPEQGRPSQPPGAGPGPGQPSTPGQPAGQPGQQPYGTPSQQPTPQPGPPQQPGTPAAATGQPTAQPGQAPTQRGQPTTPGGYPVQAQQSTTQPSIQQVRDQLREFDNSLTVQQQKAQAEINSVPPQSVAQSIAISKYNLIVEIRQSIRELRDSLTTGP